MPPISLLTGGLDFSNKFIILKAAPGGGTFATPAEALERVTAAFAELTEKNS